MKTMKKLITLLAVVGMVLALAPAAMAATINWDGDVDDKWSTVTGGGDGFGNWDADPTTGGPHDLVMGGNGSTTVDTDTTSWDIAKLTLSTATDTINIGPGATLKTTSAFRNGTTIQTGGTVNMTGIKESNQGTTQISGGSYFVSQWRNAYIYAGTEEVLHITGSTASSIQVSTFLTSIYAGKDLPEISYTLDASGVTPLKVSVMGAAGNLDKLTINVDGMANYTGTDPIPLFIDINSAISNPGVITAGTIPVGWELTLGKTTTDNDTIFLTIPEPATMSLLAIGGLALLRRRRRA